MKIHVLRISTMSGRPASRGSVEQDMPYAAHEPRSMLSARSMSVWSHDSGDVRAPNSLGLQRGDGAESPSADVALAMLGAPLSNSSSVVGHALASPDTLPASDELVPPLMPSDFSRSFLPAPASPAHLPLLELAPVPGVASGSLASDPLASGERAALGHSAPARLPQTQSSFTPRHSAPPHDEPAAALHPPPPRPSTPPEPSPLPDYMMLFDPDETHESADQSQTALLPRDSIVSLYSEEQPPPAQPQPQPQPHTPYTPRRQRTYTSGTPHDEFATPYTMTAGTAPVYETPNDTWSEIADEIITPYSERGVRKRRPGVPDTPTYMVGGHRRTLSNASSTVDLYAAQSHDDLAEYPPLGAGGVGSGVSLGSPGAAKKLGTDSYTDVNRAVETYFAPDDYESHVFVGTYAELQGTEPDWDEPRTHAGPFSMRGCVNLGSIMLLVLALLMLFLGYPLLTSLRSHDSPGDHLPSGVPNASAIAPYVRNALVDPATHREAYTATSLRDGRELQLVFSDEFELEGRSFYPGDDPYWEAVDLDYWVTQNFEWYSPESITTIDGKLVITLDEHPTHNKNFRGGMLQSWNKFCFTGGYLEARVQLAGRPNVSGLWPAIWTMGNLGRAGYGASTQGVWPYSYDECDVGTLPNQTYPMYAGGGPLDALSSGHYVDEYGPALSFQQGQRLSACTCPESDDHPGPRLPDGTWKPRAAPEIDLFEATGINGPDKHGQVSMSYQVAPFDTAYNYTTEDDAFIVHNRTRAEQNNYNGSPYQEAVSVLANTTDAAYQRNGGEYSIYGVEFRPGGPDEDAYITWSIDHEPVATINASALRPNPGTEVGQRTISREPMYVIMNLGISESFTWVNWPELKKDFPAQMRVDYVRVYQDKDRMSVSCSPPDMPTADYIRKHAEVYTNANLTTWNGQPEDGGYGQAYPPNRLLGQCR